MKKILAAVAAALALAAPALGADGNTPASPVPAGPSLVTVPIPVSSVASAALEGGPEELTIAGSSCAPSCSVQVRMEQTSGRDLRSVDPDHVATLVVNGSSRITLVAADSMRQEIAGAINRNAALQRVIGVFLIALMGIVSVLLVELSPMRIANGRRIALRASVASWAIALLPVSLATALVILSGAGSRGFLLAAFATSLFIPLLRVVTVDVFERGRVGIAL